MAKFVGPCSVIFTGSPKSRVELDTNCGWGLLGRPATFWPCGLFSLHSSGSTQLDSGLMTPPPIRHLDIATTLDLPPRFAPYSNDATSLETFPARYRLHDITISTDEPCRSLRGRYHRRICAGRARPTRARQSPIARPRGAHRREEGRAREPQAAARPQRCGGDADGGAGAEAVDVIGRNRRYGRSITRDDLEACIVPTCVCARLERQTN